MHEKKVGISEFFIQPIIAYKGEFSSTKKNPSFFLLGNKNYWTCSDGQHGEKNVLFFIHAKAFEGA